MINVLITGVHGLLGQAIVSQCSGKYSPVATDLDENTFFKNDDCRYFRLDITDRRRVKQLLTDYNPGYIINTAAFSNVDNCEGEREKCWRINVEGTKNLADACLGTGTHLVHLSTDYVFSGKQGDYAEDDRQEPINFYGKSKLASENAIISSGCAYTIIRTASLYGYDMLRKRNNFVTWVVESMQKNKNLKIADDQIACPTYVPNLAAAIWKIIRLEKTGIYHVTGSEKIDRYEFTKKIAKIFKLDSAEILPIKMKDIPGRKADRPHDSGLIISKFLEDIEMEMYSVEKGLHHFYQRYGHYFGYVLSAAGN